MDYDIKWLLICKNEKYTGTAIVNKLTKTDIMASHKVIKKDEKEWIKIENELPTTIV